MGRHVSTGRAESSEALPILGESCRNAFHIFGNNDGFTRDLFLGLLSEDVPPLK